MEKIFLLILIVAFSNNVNGQISKKQLIIGGVVSGNYSSTDQFYQESDRTLRSEEQYTLNIPVGLGYFIMNKWAVGIQCNYLRNQREIVYVLDPDIVNYEGMIKEEYNQFGLGVFTRFYVLPQKNSFNIYLSTGYSYPKLTYNLEGVNDYNNESSSYRLHQFNFSIAPVYFINNRIAIEFVMSYINESGKYGTYINSNTFLLGIGLQGHFGNPKP
jgi:hypothetical protein